MNFPRTVTLKGDMKLDADCEEALSKVGSDTIKKTMKDSLGDPQNTVVLEFTKEGLTLKVMREKPSNAITVSKKVTQKTYKLPIVRANGSGK